MSEVVRGNRHKYIVGVDDIPIKLIHKETKAIQYAYKNIYDKVYIWLYDNDKLLFIRDKALNKYDIEEVTE